MGFPERATCLSTDSTPPRSEAERRVAPRPQGISWLKGCVGKPGSPLKGGHAGPRPRAGRTPAWAVSDRSSLLPSQHCLWALAQAQLVLLMDFREAREPGRGGEPDCD